MTSAQKNLFSDALKLPKEMKIKLAEELLSSVYKQNGEWNEAVLEGARVAENRLKEARSGKSRFVTEEEMEAFIQRKMKR